VRRLAESEIGKLLQVAASRYPAGFLGIEQGSQSLKEENHVPQFETRNVNCAGDFELVGVLKGSQ
jgi:hypothetical protein